MKRKGYIYEIIIAKTTIETAILKASKGKRKRKEVQRILADIPYYTDQIYDMLSKQTYIPSPYIISTIKDGMRKKERTIYKPKFYPDQIIHWCVYLIVQPVLLSGVYEFSCGSIPGKGIHYAKRYIERWVQRDIKNTKYYLQLDVTKFYPSIDIDILMKKLQGKIKDEKALALIELIIRQLDQLPIGILLSQMLANYFLQEMDHFIKQNLMAKHYLRYMDDMIIFGANKKELHRMRKIISKEMEKINLRLKPNWQVKKTALEFPDIVGFRFCRNRTILRKSLMYRITRRARKIKKKSKPTVHDAQAIISYMGWIKHSDTFKVYEKWIKPCVNIKHCKKLARRESKWNQEYIKTL